MNHLDRLRNGCSTLARQERENVLQKAVRILAQNQLREKPISPTILESLTRAGYAKEVERYMEQRSDIPHPCDVIQRMSEHWRAIQRDA